MANRFLWGFRIVKRDRSTLGSSLPAVDFKGLRSFRVFSPSIFQRSRVLPHRNKGFKGIHSIHPFICVIGCRKVIRWEALPRQCESWYPLLKDVFLGMPANPRVTPAFGSFFSNHRTPR